MTEQKSVAEEQAFAVIVSTLDQLPNCDLIPTLIDTAEILSTKKAPVKPRHKPALKLATALKRATKAGLAVTGVTFDRDGAVTGITVDQAPTNSAFDETPEHLRKLV